MDVLGRSGYRRTVLPQIYLIACKDFLIQEDQIKRLTGRSFHFIVPGKPTSEIWDKNWKYSHRKIKTPPLLSLSLYICTYTIYHLYINRDLARGLWKKFHSIRHLQKRTFFKWWTTWNTVFRTHLNWITAKIVSFKTTHFGVKSLISKFHVKIPKSAICSEPQSNNKQECAIASSRPQNDWSSDEIHSYMNFIYDIWIYFIYEFHHCSIEDHRKVGSQLPSNCQQNPMIRSPDIRI